MFTLAWDPLAWSSAAWPGTASMSLCGGGSTDLRARDSSKTRGTELEQLQARPVDECKMKLG